MLSPQDLPRVKEFLHEIGIHIVHRALPQGTFLPGVEIEHGTLVVDESQLLSPGDLLHEAGHLAVMLPEQRIAAKGDLKLAESQRDGEELAAIAWSYAAAMHIGMDSSVLFHEHGYKGDYDWLREVFASENPPYTPLLVWMQLCNPPGPEGFPKMKKWMREVQPELADPDQ